MEELVSIIAPCYNMERYIGNFLESILNQTYPHIELIVINDPKTNDQSENIIKSYISKFEHKGYKLIYILNECSGGAATKINTGFGRFSGKYMMWMDSDDMLYEHAIEVKVRYFEDNPNVEFSLCDGIIVDENNNKIGKIGREGGIIDNLFSDYIYERNVVCCPCTFFIRRESFLKLFPERRIYENNSAQNWQLILPSVYSLKVGYIREQLYKYLYREDSISHRKADFKFWENKRKDFIDILVHSIDSIELMDDETKEYWKKIAVLRQLYMLLNLCSENKMKKEYNMYCNEILHLDGHLRLRNRYNIHRLRIFMKNKFGI